MLIPLHAIFFLPKLLLIVHLPSTHVYGGVKAHNQMPPPGSVQDCAVSTFDAVALGSEAFEFEAAAIAVMAAINDILPGSSREVVLVGYSLGARLALYLSSHFGNRFKMVVSISGSAGIAGKVQCLLLHAAHNLISQSVLLEVLSQSVLHA